MINPFKEVQWHPGLAEKKAFARSLMIGFPCLALVVFFWGWARAGVWDANLRLALGLGGGGGLLGLFLWRIPGAAKPFYVVWFLAGCAIGFVVSNGLLSLAFFGVVTPIGWLKRTFGTPGLRKTFDRAAPSYWRDSEQGKNPERYYKQF